MIEITDLTKFFNLRTGKKKKKFKKITAVDHINLKIKKGEIFGLIGPNAAGKTTTLKILSTLILPDQGTASIDGYDIILNPEIVKAKIGLLAGEFVRSFYWRLSGRQNLKFFAKLRSIKNPEKRVNELIDLFQLKDYENELVMKYSTGIKHKFALATGLLHNPPVLFLDEPLSGIDPVTQFEIKNIIKNEFKDKTIIWASHNLYEVEEMCDRISLLNKGQVVLEGSSDKLKGDYWDHTKISIISDKPETFKLFEKAEIIDGVIQIKTKNINTTLLEILEFIKKENIEILDIKTMKPTLEDIFMRRIKNV